MDREGKMNSLVKVILLVGLMTIIGTSSASAQTIYVDSIERDQMIQGHVSGLSPQSYNDYKVIVYAKTDTWYIHPYAGQGEGLSWAAIRPDGRWVIQTVARQFQAEGLAVLLVKRNLPESNKVGNPNQIPAVAKLILSGNDLRARGFHGLL
jgi:hypothetical protein